MTIRHTTSAKTFWRRHQQTISIKSRKEEVKSILTENKESKTINTSEVVETCKSRRSAEPIITDLSVSDNVKKAEDEILVNHNLM